MKEEEQDEAERAAELEMDAYEPITHIKIGKRDWPLYPLTVRDIRQSHMLQLISIAQSDPAKLSPMSDDEGVQDKIDDFVWVLLRKGAPGMTRDRIHSKRWIPKDQLLDLVPFLVEGDPITWALLKKFGLAGQESDEPVNP